MTGERLMWHRIAFHLKTTVHELREKLTYSEFWDWLRFLELEDTRRTKQDYYLAQIAQFGMMAIAKNPNTVRLSDFLLDIQFASQPVLSPEESLARSKAMWAGVVGTKVPGRAIPKKVKNIKPKPKGKK